MSGKGDNPRPLSVTPEQFAERFDAIDWNAREREAAIKRAYGPTAREVQTSSGPCIAVRWATGDADFGVIAVDGEDKP